MMLKILCFGGRDFGQNPVDACTVRLALTKLSEKNGPFIIVNGGAHGADRLCKDWGLSMGYPVITMDAAWDALGKRAGSIRNGWMLEHVKIDGAVAFPGGIGTADMAKKVRAAGVQLWEPCTLC